MKTPKVIFQIGDLVEWHSKTKRRKLKGQIAQLYPRKAMVIWTTFDGRGHHWIAPYWKLKKLHLESEA